MHDVIVIGGGPAGLMAARTLAENGHDVVVLEEHPEIGRPVHCTGLIGLEAFDELDLPRDTILRVIKSATFHAPSGVSIALSGPRLAAAVVDRAAFDAALAGAATRYGASIRLGARARRIHVDRHRVSVQTAEQQVTGRALVLACGASYRLSRMAGLGLPSQFAHSAQLEIPFRPADHIDVYFRKALAPGGFAWVVPFSRDGGHFARVGLMCNGPAHAPFQAFTAHLGLSPENEQETNASLRPRTKVMPLARVDKIVTDRAIAVGDAAGLVKPTTGGGIYYSLLSGRLAGEVLDQRLRQDSLDESALNSYDLQCRSRFGAEMRAGSAFRAVAARLDDADIEALLEVARTDGIVPMLLKRARFNWHRGAALTLLRHRAFRQVAVSALLG